MTYQVNIIVIFLTTLIVSCSGGSSSDSGNSATTEVQPAVDGNSTPVTVFNPAHTVLGVQDKVHGISGVVLADGRFIGKGFISPIKQTGLFSTGPDFSIFTALTPKPVRYSEFSGSRNRTIYLDNEILYSSDLVTSQILSGTDIVERFWLSPDQTKVIYIANTSVSKLVDPVTARVTFKRRSNLYIVDVQGGSRIQLNSATDSDILHESLNNPKAPHKIRPQFLPDMSRVIYVATIESSGTSELHSVRLDGSDHKILNANLTDDTLGLRNEFTFTFTSNSSHVIYGIRVGGVMELYSISPDGIGNTKISGSLVAGGTVFSASSGFSVMPSLDNKYVLFLADAETIELNELYRVSLNGSNRVKLSNGSNVFRVEPLITANGQTIIYVANGLYSVSANGGAVTNLTSALVNPRIFFKPVLTNDQTAVVFLANDNTVSLSKSRLLLSKLDGTATIDLSGAMIETGGVSIAAGTGPAFILDPVVDRLVFSANALINSDNALFAVNLDGSNRVKITPDRLYAGTSLSKLFGFFGNKIYFSYDRDFKSLGELYTYDFSNNSLTNLSAQWPKFISEDAQRSSLSHSSDGIVRSFFSNKAAFRDAAVVNMNGRSSCRIELLENNRLVYGVSNYFLDPAAKNLYYTLLNTNDTREPWRFYKSDTSTCVSTLVNQGITEKLIRSKVSPDGTYLAFSGTADVTVGRKASLYLTLTDGSSAIKLNPNQAVGGLTHVNNGAFGFSPDSSRVLYWADQDTAGVTELYSVTVDGKTTNKINAAFGANDKLFVDANYFTPQVSPNNQWLVYKAKQSTVSTELFKSKLDGTGNVQLSRSLVDSGVYTGGRSGSVQITTDSSKVVYLVSALNGVTDLYYTNLIGTSNPIKLNSNFFGLEQFIINRNSKFTLTTNSNSVIYLARDDASLPVELYVSTLNNTATTNKLNLALAADTEVANFSVTADGSKVAYHTTGIRTGDVKLYVSNIDGSDKKFLVSPIGIQTHSIVNPLLTADNRVIFRAVLNQVDGIYSMSLLGGVARLVFAIDASQSIEKIVIANNAEITVLGDLRVEGIKEVFSFSI